MRNGYVVLVAAVLVGAAGCEKSTTRTPGGNSHLTGDCAQVDCTPGEAKECSVDGVKGVQQCANTCQWGTCQTVDKKTDTDQTGATDSETEEVFLPPPESCPPGTFEFNIQNIFSADVTPHLNSKNAGDGLPFDLPPNALLIAQQVDFQESYGARQLVDNCNFYRTCLPVGWTTVYIKPVNPATECVLNEGGSAPITLPDTPEGGVLTMTYEGTNEELTNDYFDAAWTGNTINGFTFSNERPEETEVTDPLEYKPACQTSDDYITLHIRWPWGDPDTQHFAGTACEDDKAGITTPPYPSTLSVKMPGVCDSMVAVLERWDGVCPWYQVRIPKAAWEGGSLAFDYQNTDLRINPIDLPSTDASELWLVYEGATDDDNAQGSPCMNFSYREGVYHFYTANLGPGYPGCGGAPAPEDCADIKPLGYSVVHFRYMWAGQKTFTYFPHDEFMPAAMVLHVNGTEYFCVQEGTSPWYRCPIPNDEFFEGSKWRAADKSHQVEWNTVEQLPTFPSKPGTYWIRWWDGKPDIPSTAKYQITDYYPDGVEWALAGGWGDDFCFSKDNVTRPPIQSDGFFPWDETNYAYANGQSIAKWYDNSGPIQNLLNYFVWDRYLLWKEQYVKEDDEACGPGTARVDSSDSVTATVSEGQGYGMAITAAIGDKETFDKLWRFVNHFLSQGDKYCGGLMGWAWDGPGDCQPYGTNATSGGNRDSAFDGDVDIAIGLVYAAWQWPEYTQDAVEWLLKMECEINTRYDGVWYYPTPGDTWDKNCANYPGEPCSYEPGRNGTVNMSYYPPGYFRVFGEFLAANLPAAQYTIAERLNHLDFWYHVAETTWELVERCYDDGIHPALAEDFGTYDHPCSTAKDNYNWSRALWRLAVDAAWYGKAERDTDVAFPSATPGSSRHFDGKSQMQAKMDAIMDYYAFEFPQNNPGEPNANRFSTICKDVNPSGQVSGCDPGYDHNGYFVTTAMTPFVTFYDADGKVTPDIRREALEEAVSVAIEDYKYYQDTLSVYQLLFLTGNFPRPFSKMQPTTVIIE